MDPVAVKIMIRILRQLGWKLGLSDSTVIVKQKQLSRVWTVQRQCMLTKNLDSAMTVQYSA